MKKILSILITAAMLITPLTAAYSDGDIRVTLDGAELTFDVPPQIIENRTMVPMRAIFEALGAEVEWYENTRTVGASKYSDDNNRVRIILPIGSGEMQKSLEWVGQDAAEVLEKNTVTLDVPAQIIDGRTLVPIRAISEAFDCDVEWDGENQTVIITSAQPEETAVSENTALPTAAPSAEQTEVPDETTAPEDFPIEYDDTNERKSHEVRDFEILSLEKNSEGDYVMTYKLRTFLEGRGTIGASFNCLDSDGKVADTFGRVFKTTDYTWTWQEDTVTISGNTVKIELVLNQ